MHIVKESYLGRPRENIETTDIESSESRERTYVRTYIHIESYVI